MRISVKFDKNDHPQWDLLDAYPLSPQYFNADIEGIEAFLYIGKNKVDVASRK